MFLIGAYGLFWHRSEVGWGHHKPWQLIGHSQSSEKNEVLCDFTHAQGFYVLYDDYSANYVGLARGKKGIGARLVDHHFNKVAGMDDWTRFSWFSIGEVHADRGTDGWHVVEPREELDLTPELAVKEFESLLIKLLGTRRQNQMSFQNGQKWEQLTTTDIATAYWPWEVDREPIRDWRLKKAYEDFADE